MPQFPAGQSGNPSGRPKGSQNKLTVARRELEELVHAKLPKPELAAKIARAIEAIADKAEDGDLKAAKLLFEYTLAKPRADDDDKGGDRRILVVIENLSVSTPIPNGETPPTGITFENEAQENG